MKKHHFYFRLSAWYLTIFAIIVFCFATLVFLHIRKQVWNSFNIGVALVNGEMYEEIEKLKEKFHIIDADSVKWNDQYFQRLHTRVAQEVIDETVDNHLKKVGFVRMVNILSGRKLYESPQIRQRKLSLQARDSTYWGYLPLHLNVHGKAYYGYKYWGKRLDYHYFAGILFDPNFRPFPNDSIRRRVSRRVVHYVDRKGAALIIKNRKNLEQYLRDHNAWAYVYVFETDSVLWCTKPFNQSGLYIPTYYPEKNFYVDLRDGHGYHFKQYTEIKDISPNWIYRIDLVVPSDYVRRSLLLTGLAIYSGASLLILMAWAGGRLVAQKTVQAVNTVIEAVKDITSKNLDRRLPVPDIDDEITQLTLTFNDLLDRLARSFKLQKSFIADTSHELRTPLSILMSDIETALAQVHNGKDVAKSLTEASLEIQNMARIVDDLNWLARSDAGQIYIQKAPIRLDEVLLQTLSRCQVLAAKRNIKLNVGEMEILEYRGDENLLIRALSNLVNNAIKYSPDGEKVVISLLKNEHVAIFRVQDYGIGIPGEERDKIFERFYRVDSSRSRTTGGSGLGLSIAKWIIELHGGEIEVESEVAKGTTFQVKLPF